jgi:signal transduction histidine kinase
MRKLRLRRLAIVFSVALTLLTLTACVALKLVTDVMAARAEKLALIASEPHDPSQLAEQHMRIEQWSRRGDYIALGIGTLVVLGSVVIIVGAYRYVFAPLFGLAESMRGFTAGQREVRAGRSTALELDSAAGNFNAMADIITEQHARMVEFLGGAVHELRDPVQLIRVALQPFAPGRPFPTEQLTRTKLALVSRELDRLERMMETYLDAGNVEWRRLDLQQGKQDLRALVQESVRLYETFSANHRLVLSVPEEPVFVYGDPGRLSQVFHSLVINAIQFSPRGGIVEVTLAVAGTEATVSVTDHGIGIADKDLPALFEPFQRMTVAQQRGPGASVALSVARRIVEAQQGRIEVQSKVGEGSTFRVHLPIAEPPSPRESERPAQHDGAFEAEARH